MQVCFRGGKKVKNQYKVGIYCVSSECEFKIICLIITDYPDNGNNVFDEWGLKNNRFRLDWNRIYQSEFACYPSLTDAGNICRYNFRA